ncbi:Unknown protein [Striga hermonthica]|uniref:Uncharacterized protein n=1 Tax=Striga hermonthica TaxID=68872 RepID=A0A9N7R8Y6_STRHE|nr:Unknown protein [Striga hermonthica]
MENEAVISKVIKVKIPEITSPKTGPVGPNSSLSRQGSVSKHNCLCSPTTHAGSFRCRLHRGPGLQRSSSMGPHDEADPKGSVCKSGSSVDAVAN